jgi:hypothetical protein
VALTRTKNKVTAPPTVRTMVASAARIPVEGFTWPTAPYSADKAWQAETWRLYNCIGELHDAADYIGSACSRVKIGVYEVDDYGNIQGEASDPEIRALGTSLFGGPGGRAEIQRALGISLTVAGEAYLIGRTVNGTDRWTVAAPTELNSEGPRLFLNQGEVSTTLAQKKDFLMRVWTPHPANMWFADAPARSALHVLSQLEKLTRYTDSQLDSRIANGMVWCIPAGMDFPRADDQSVAEALLELILEAMEASLTGLGQAAGIAPIIIEIPADLPAPIAELLRNPIRFESLLSEVAAPLRDEAIRRLSISMNIPPEVLLGMGQSANHFNIWHVEESAVKIHVEPIMVRICDALSSWLYAAMITLGRKSEIGKYVYWFDTSTLTVRPNRLADAVSLYDKEALSAEALRRYGDFKEADAPSAAELSQRRTMEVILRDPTLFADANVREEAGIDVETEALGTSSTPPPPPPTPEITNMAEGPAPFTDLPDNARSAPDTTTAALVASGGPILEAAHHTVRRALELAGNRLLTAQTRKTVWSGVPKFELHTKVKVRDVDHADQILASAWDTLDIDARDLRVDPQVYASAVENYTRTLLTRSIAHERTMLAAVLREVGLMR